ncbi:cytochrome P450 6a9-like [Sitodiplosis mosellana]|uniref:cytochrome P450 6a9-like n=1 Tax=Sitodiplosis mosellana TaxID=263140 RepID=UPI002444DB8F|nr:cytochrome P450 6a9-like [Sitodiplosis mosellana]
MDFLSGLAIVLISIVTIVYGYFKYSFGYWKSRNIPHEEPSFPYGNIKGFGTTIHSSLCIKRIYDKFKPTGAIFCGAYFFARPVAIILNLNFLKNILVKDFANFNERGFFYNEEDDPISAHLFAMDGDKWKELRAKLTPTFTSGKMKFMFPTVVEVGKRFKDCLIDVVKENDELEIKELLARFTTDVIGTCAFGIECNSLKDPNAEFRKYGREVFGKPRHSPLAGVFLGGFKGTARKLHIKNIRDDVSEFFMKVVRDTVDYREKNNVNRNDFMDILIKLKNQKGNDKDKITLNEIAAQAFVFFLAGFETSSTTLTFCLYELAMNAEIQVKARQVIQEAYEKHGKFIYEMMLDMPYVDQVLQETLRKYPPLANLNRYTKNTYKVPGTDDVIEKGTPIIIPALSIQRDPEYYPDAEKFDPDRFNSEAVKQRDAMTWLPFGEGPRNCIGLRFGMMQARIGLVTILNNFEVSFGPKSTVPLVIDAKSAFLSPEGGVYLKFKPIQS